MSCTPPQWSLGSTLCGQVSLVLLEHLCLSILP